MEARRAELEARRFRVRGEIREKEGWLSELEA